MNYIAFNRINLWPTCTTAYRESNYIFSPINGTKALNILGEYVTILWNMLLPMYVYYVCINIKNSAFCSQHTRKYDILRSPYKKEPHRLIFVLETLGSQRSKNGTLNFWRWTVGFKRLVNIKKYLRLFLPVSGGVEPSIWLRILLLQEWKIVLGVAVGGSAGDIYEYIMGLTRNGLVIHTLWDLKYRKLQLGLSVIGIGIHLFSPLFLSSCFYWFCGADFRTAVVTSDIRTVYQYRRCGR
jgi:hypothetical protein